MNYRYSELKEKVFTESGQEMFLKIRDRAHELIDNSGAARLGAIIQGTTGDEWTMMACVDRLVELGEISEIEQSQYAPGQNRIFVKRNP